MNKKKKKKSQVGYKTQSYQKEISSGTIPGDAHKGKHNDDDLFSSMKSSKANDKKWYNNLPELLNSVTIPNFLQNVGSVEIGDFGALAYDRIGVTPVAAMNLRLTVGDNNQQAVTTSIRKLYANLRRVNTGSVVYTPTDLLHYIYNLRAAVAVDRFLRRAYGCINKYDARNSKQPYAIFTAMGLDYDSFRDNKANLRLILNNNAVRLHTLMAGKCDLIERTAWLFDGIFTDGHTHKAQMYIMNPLEVPYWDYASSTWKFLNVPLTTNATTNTGRSLTQALVYFNTLMDNVYANNNVPIISADIIKAYGLGQSDAYFNIIPEDYTIKEIYSEEVLIQLQNAVITGPLAGGITPTDSESYLVQTGAIATDIGTTDTLVEHFATPYINTYKDSINILDFTEHTRFVVYGNSIDSNNRVVLSTYGTEIVETVMFAVPFSSNNLGIVSAVNPYGLARVIYSPTQVPLYGGSQTIAYSEMYKSLWALFDWMPAFRTMVIGYYPANSSTYNYTVAANYMLKDLDNFYKADSGDVFSNINNVVVQSLLYWPSVIRDTRVASLGK